MPFIINYQIIVLYIDILHITSIPNHFHICHFKVLYIDVIKCNGGRSKHGVHEQEDFSSKPIGDMCLYYSGWWFQTFVIFHFIYIYIWDVILPIDELIFLMVKPPLTSNNQIFDVLIPSFSH